MMRTVRLGSDQCAPNVVKFIGGYVITDDTTERTVYAVTGNVIVAERIAELLDRYGLVDIPDELS